MPREPTAGPLHMAMRGHAAADVRLRRTARLCWRFPEGIELARRRWAQEPHRTLMPVKQGQKATPRNRHLRRVIRALIGV
jgi:hypothetical protein